MTDEASRLALSYAMDLAAKQQGQPWGPEPIVAAAERFKTFLAQPVHIEMDGPVDWVLRLLEDRDQRIQALENQMGALERSLTPQRGKRAATNTTPPDGPIEF